MLDRYVWGDVKRVSPEAPVPIVTIHHQTGTLGGAANVALNLSVFGVKVELIGVVGNDEAGTELTSTFRAKRIKFNKIFKKDSVKTIVKQRVVAQRHQICRLDREDRSENYELCSQEEIKYLLSAIYRAKVVIISDYAKGVVSQKIIDVVKSECTKQGRFLAMDPKPKRIFDLRGLNLLTPNWDEAKQLAGQHILEQSDANLKTVSKIIRKKYNPEHLVITLGENGIYLDTRFRPKCRFPTIAKEVADVSGAGDTVVAFMAMLLACGENPEVAIQIANLAAGIVVEKMGTATVSRKEMVSRIARTNFPQPCII